MKKKLSFNNVSSKSLTISDLQEIKEKVDEEKSSSFFPYWRNKLGSLLRKREKNKVEEDLKELGLEEVQEGDVDLEEVKRTLESSELKEEKDFEPNREELSKISEETRNELEPEKEEIKEKTDELSKEEMDRIIFGNDKF